MGRGRDVGEDDLHVLSRSMSIAQLLHTLSFAFNTAYARTLHSPSSAQLSPDKVLCECRLLSGALGAAQPVLADPAPARSNNGTHSKYSRGDSVKGKRASER